MQKDRVSGKKCVMEKRIENLETKARIKGLPTWHLTGVTSDAVPVIRDTGFWVHYRSFGLDGWYVAAPDAVLPHFKAALAKKGVGFEGVKRLPRKYYWLLAIPVHFYMMFGWLLAVGGVPHMGKVWLFVTLAHLISMATSLYQGRPLYAEMFVSAAENRSYYDNGHYLDSINPDLVGTRGWHASN